MPVYKAFAFLLTTLLVVPGLLAAEPISIVAVGDLLLGGSASQTVRLKGFAYPFLGTMETIRQADIALANLEAPLTSRGVKHPDKQFTFRVPPAAADEIRQAGFDLMTLANNHMGDFGEQGVLDTITALEEAGLGFTGAGRDLKQARTPHVITIDGTSFAFLAYSNTFPESFYAKKDKPGTAPGYFDQVAADIRRASRQYDVVIVSFHWGGERLNEPKNYQVELGHIAIDSGAKVVIGHHPHVLQGAERYHGGVIYYSLGNFAFGSYSESSAIAGLARIWFEGDQLTRAEILPLNVFNLEVQFQPRVLAHGPAYAFARDFNDYSEPLNSKLVRQPDLFWGIEEMPKSEEIAMAAEEVLAQGRRPDGHQDSKESRKSEKAL